MAGAGDAIAVHSDGITLLTPQNPVRPNEVVVMYGAGLGASIQCRHHLHRTVTTATRRARARVRACRPPRLSRRVKPLTADLCGPAVLSYWYLKYGISVCRYIAPPTLHIR